MITNDLQNRIHFGDRDAFYAIYREYGLGIYAAARKALSTGDLVYVVVGDAAVVKPQLDGLGLPVEIAKPAN